jgi:seryl-tRNA synthetase
VGTRYGVKKQGEQANYCHFLNSTLCATGRAICCLLENYQEADGVRIPDVLVPYMGGVDFLPFVRGPMELTKGEKGKDKKAAAATSKE